MSVNKRSSSRPSAVVLLSGGLDSSYNLLKALEKFTVRLALTVNYGQRAARREIESASELAFQYDVPHEVLFLPWFERFTKSSLVTKVEIPSGKRIEIDNLEKSKASAKSVWVPNRNGILLNISAGFAEGLGADYVIPGFNLEEARTFPDNSGEYLKALDRSFSYSTGTGVKTHCFSTALDKSAIVREAKKLGLPFSMLWPCYQSRKFWCGECESCQRFKRALEANGISFAELRTGQKP